MTERPTTAQATNSTSASHLAGSEGSAHLAGLPGSAHLAGLPGSASVVDDVPRAFAEAVIDAFATRPGSPFSRFVLVLSGGSTARLCYEALANEGAATIDWALVDVLMGDERCVAPDDEDSNQRLVRESLLDEVADVGNFHPMSCAEGPEAYETVLNDFPHIDVIHLGMGPDGHTASLFPGSSALAAPHGCLALINEDPSGRNPHPRMTITFEAISRARLALVTVAGRAKASALYSVAAGEDLPAARISAESVQWIVDREAAEPPT